MTVITLASVKGAPGVTTVACLIAATWPTDRRVVLVEGDPSGGDLAARFQLSTRRGLSSFASASRRLQGFEAIESHVQQLPGGLDVMVSAKPLDAIEARWAFSAVLSSATSDPHGTWDVVVDIGRLLPGEQHVDAWLERSGMLLIVLRREAASIVNVRDRVPSLRSRYPGRIGLVLIGGGPFARKEIEQFTGLPALAELPNEPAAAQIVGGRPGGLPRLSRTLLVLSSQRLARTLSAGAFDEMPEAGSVHDLTDMERGDADRDDADRGGLGLASADLASADLASADLASADLASADLASADLASADLASADLAGADCAEAGELSAAVNSEATTGAATSEGARGPISGNRLARRLRLPIGSRVDGKSTSQAPRNIDADRHEVLQ